MNARACIILMGCSWFATIFLPNAASAAVGTTRGTEVGLWKKNSVVYAEVSSVAKSSPNRAVLSLDVKATLAGTIDPTDHSVIEVAVFAGLDSAIQDIPKVHSRVVAFIRVGKANRLYIPSDIVLFMPNRAGVCEVESFEDPKVERLIAALRFVRRLKDDRSYKIQKFLDEQFAPKK